MNALVLTLGICAIVGTLLYFTLRRRQIATFLLGASAPIHFIGARGRFDLLSQRTDPVRPLVQQRCERNSSELGIDLKNVPTVNERALLRRAPFAVVSLCAAVRSDSQRSRELLDQYLTADYSYMSTGANADVEEMARIANEISSLPMID